MSKNGLSNITDNFINKIEREIANGSLEGTMPKKTEHKIGNGYKINSNGQIITESGKIMKYIFRKGKRSPYVVSKNTKELRINKLMGTYFKHYIKGYKETQLNKNKTFIVIPQDSNREDMSLTNLEFIEEKEYKLLGSKKQILKQIIPLLKSTPSDKDITNTINISRSRTNKIKAELKKEGKIGHPELNNLIISNKTYPIYLALLKSEGLKSNLELAKQLRKTEDFTDKKVKKIFTEKIVRVRKKLVKKGLIQKYDTYQNHK